VFGSEEGDCTEKLIGKHACRCSFHVRIEAKCRSRK
jgi:hypothetical protein